MWVWYFLCVCIHTNVNTCTQTKTSSTIPPLQLQPNIFPSRCCELRWPGFPSCFLLLTQNMRQFLCYVQVKSRIKCAFIFQTKDIDTTSPCPHTSNFFLSYLGNLSWIHSLFSSQSPPRFCGIFYPLYEQLQYQIYWTLASFPASVLPLLYKGAKVNS